MVTVGSLSEVSKVFLQLFLVTIPITYNINYKCWNVLVNVTFELCGLYIYVRSMLFINDCQSSLSNLIWDFYVYCLHFRPISCFLATKTLVGGYFFSNLCTIVHNQLCEGKGVLLDAFLEATWNKSSLR